MSGEEKTVAKFLSYKESTGNEVCVDIDPDVDIKERMDFLKRHGCRDFVLLDADKKPIK